MSLRKAVNAMCKDCIYDPIGGTGTWRMQVFKCTSKNCALYPHRPTPSQTITKVEIVESSSINEPICTIPEPIQLKEAS